MDPTATAPGTYNGPLPGAGQFGLYQAGVEQAYQNAKTTISGQRSQFLQGQGLSGQYDSTGNYTGFGIDANSPTGAYQQMNSANAQAGATNTAAFHGEGFMGGGVMQGQQEAAQKGYSLNAANWAQNAVMQLGNLGQQDIANTQNRGQQEYSGLLSDVQTAIANGSYNPANYSGITMPDGTVFKAPPLGTGGTTAPWQPGPPGGGGGTGGRTVYGYGIHGTPFYSKAAATAAGRLGKGKAS